MKRNLLAVGLMTCCLTACGPVDHDDGAPDPGSWWPWVCADGGPAPDSGCTLDADGSVIEAEGGSATGSAFTARR